MSTVYAIGIDFGTSNSCVTYATYYEDMNGRLEGTPIHRPEALTFQHKDTIATVVFLGDGADQQPLCGEMAEEKAVFFPELTRSGFKLRLGRPGQSGRDAFLLSKQFLAYLRTRLADFVPLDQPAQNQRIETIIGHPVQWSIDQREETRRAAHERSLLLREVRRFKETFSNHVREGVDRYETMWLVGGKPLKVSLTRLEFETVAAHYITHFEALVRGALELAKVATRQVSSLILAGGHSRWYFVDDTLKNIFPHISRENFTLLRHNHPEQSVARGLAYVPMVRASGARLLAPVRKSAHSLWLYVPYGRALNSSDPGGPIERPEEAGASSEDPVLILPRGQPLPYAPPR